MLSIPTGPHLSDALVSSAIVQGEDGSGAPSGGSFDPFGVDPNEDPELALALRVSMEEQRARQEAENASSGGGAATSGGTGSGEGAQTEATSGSAMEAEDDPVLARALAMSVGGSAGGGEPDLSAMTEDEQIAYAMRMSMQDDAAGAANPAGAAESSEKMDVDEQPAGEKNEDDYSEAMNDPAFLQSVLENLPGVDPQSDAVRQAVGAMSKDAKKDEEKKDDKGKK